jgi:lipopolysaccharide biosynthesis protein
LIADAQDFYRPGFIRNGVPLMRTKSVRAIAFFLPQFHPIPENDAWWGKGFTEWTNVAKAQPLFEGHYQPHLPADLGFYDLRLPETREAQAALARQHGVYGFCYYHYWFHGKRLLERPVNEILGSSRPDFPFCLCWANESWSRCWNGQDNDVLLKQTYSANDDLQHIRSLLPKFRDPRYIKVDGKPLFLIYRIAHLPEPAETVRRWRDEVAKAGLPGIYLANVESFAGDHAVAPKLGLDAAVEFAPDWHCLPPRRRPAWWSRFSLRRRAARMLRDNYVSEYGSLVDRMLRKPDADYLRYRCVTPMWDNSARRGRSAAIFVDSTPERYGQWLAATVDAFPPPSREENFVFINAWNEWAEGNHLEPCQKWGRAYLEATKKALVNETPSSGCDAKEATA